MTADINPFRSSTRGITAVARMYGNWITALLVIPFGLGSAATARSQSPQFLDSRNTALAESDSIPAAPDASERMHTETSSTSPSSGKLYAELANEAEAMSRQYSLLKRLIKTIQPSVVHIEAKKQKKQSSSSKSDSNKDWPQVEEAGSGVIFEYRNKFYILTNYHVIENSELNDIQIEADGRRFNPIKSRNDVETDLSVLFVDQAGLQPSKIGDSEKMEIGDFVVAVGSPFGLSHSVSYGIISALGRRDLELGPQGVRYQNFIQTDAAINPGNSGGPLINLRGEVIGINTAIASNSGGNDGIGFSIPIKMAMRVATDLVDHGAVQRGFLGVSLDARFTPDVAHALGLDRAHGARVSAITPDSPADKVDLMVGDIVVEYDGIPVVNDSHLVTEVSLSKIGGEIPVKIYRHGKLLTITVTVEDRDSFQVSR